VSLLDGLKKDCIKVCSIEPVIEDTIPIGGSTNIPEILLGKKLDSYGFPPFKSQVRIDLPDGNYTVPDFYYSSQDETVKVAIYLDGLSKNIHSDPKQQLKDTFLRNALQIHKNVKIIPIPASVVTGDPEALRMYMQMIAMALGRSDLITE